MPGLIAGRTVARVGYGAMQLRNLGHDHDAAIALLRRAVELGVNHYDTAQVATMRAIVTRGLLASGAGAVLLTQATAATPHAEWCCPA